MKKTFLLVILLILISYHVGYGATQTIVDGVSASGSVNVLTAITTDRLRDCVKYGTNNSGERTFLIMTTDSTTTEVVIKGPRGIVDNTFNSSDTWAVCGSNECLQVLGTGQWETLTIDYTLSGSAVLTIDIICN